MLSGSPSQRRSSKPGHEDLGKRGGPIEPRGPQTVPWQMLVVWAVLNGYLYWRSSSPVRSLLPLGEKLYLREEPVVWRSPDSDVELVFPQIARRSAETAWVLRYAMPLSLSPGVYSPVLEQALMIFLPCVSLSPSPLSQRAQRLPR
jgi:hypothetical protein